LTAGGKVTFGGKGKGGSDVLETLDRDGQEGGEQTLRNLRELESELMPEAIQNLVSWNQSHPFW